MLVIIDIADTRCKIHKLNRSMWITKLNKNFNTRESSNGKIEWLYIKETVGNLLLTESYYTVVDSSFFPDKPELISMC